jgi:hypothetical protein
MAWMCPPAYIEAVARPAVARGAASVGRSAPPVLTHVTAVVTTDPATARGVVRPVVEGFGRNPRFAAMFAGAGRPLAGDGTAGDALLDAVTVHGDETGLTDRLGALAEEHDELVVTLGSAGDRRADEDTLLRALGTVTRTAATRRRAR